MTSENAAPPAAREGMLAVSGGRAASVARLQHRVADTGWWLLPAA